MPVTCKTAEVILFADDTIITAIGCQIIDVKDKIRHLDHSLHGTKLIINNDKIKQLNMKSASNSKITLYCLGVINKQNFKYLGLYIDYKLSFRSHIDSVKMRIGKQCGIISKLRHYAPRYQLLEYYGSNVVPIIQCENRYTVVVATVRLNVYFYRKRKLLNSFVFESVAIFLVIVFCRINSYRCLKSMFRK